MSQQSAVGDGPDHSPEAAEPPANQIRRSSRIQGRVLARQQSTLNSPNPEGAARGDNIAKPTERVQVIVMKGLAWMLHEERTGTAEHRAKTNGVMEN